MRTVIPKTRAVKTIPYNFSEKHMEYIRRCRDCVYNIAEGAVRAGKTVDHILAFCEELKRSPDKLHLATASTAPTAKLIIGDCNGFGVEHFFRGQCRWGKYKGNEALIIKGKSTSYREKVVIFVGGGKADSYKKFRGASIGMWIATEIDLHHQNTINEAFARMAASKHMRIFWDLNPGSPFAKIYTDYIDDYAKKNAAGELYGGYNYQKFTIYDNINITEEQRQIFISRYTPGTAEYRRKIDGDRCVTDGLIFQQFADDPERWTVLDKYKNVRLVSIGVDFGGNKSKTTFVASAVIGNYERIGVIADCKMEGEKGTIDANRIAKELFEFYQYVKAEYPNAQLPYIYCDCADQNTINTIRFYFKRKQIKTQIHDCYKGAITDRIHALNTLINQNRFTVHKDCTNVINSLSSQVWDTENPAEDVRLDNGTCDIDTADALEYSFSSYLKYLVAKGG